MSDLVVLRCARITAYLKYRHCPYVVSEITLGQWLNHKRIAEQ
jgi:hypothetical protein